MKTGVHITSRTIEATDGALLVELDGSNVRTLRDFYVAIADALRFPSSFRPNPDAFRDTLQDYDDYATTSQDICLVVNHAELLLVDEIYRGIMLRDHLRILHDAARELLRATDDSGYEQMQRTLSIVLVVDKSNVHGQELIRIVEDMNLPKI